ncbi:MAG TPA: hypothetical protein ENN78_00595, partial [Candidatus Omnitrophica bacterium]|nr:hypothetical protein [Candidatus Omnitrophota bacterium]
MKIKSCKIALTLGLVVSLSMTAYSLDVQDALKALKKFQDQQLNYCYQDYFRINGLYKSSPYVNEVDIATSGFALAGLIVAAEKGLLSQDKAKNIFIETVNACLRLQNDPKSNYHGFLYHFYLPDYSGNNLKPKSGVEVSTIDTAILLAGILTASEYFTRQGYSECRDKAREFYSNINWRYFFNGSRKQFHMAWSNGFFGFWDYYTDEVFLIAILAQGSPVVEHRVDIRDSFGNITVKQGSYKGYSYVYSWYGSLFTYLFAHAFIDFRRLDKDLVHSVDWWQNTKSAVLTDIQWCRDNGYPKDIFGISACWSKSSASGPAIMEYRDRIGSALSGCSPAERFYNNKNGVKPVAPYTAIG